MQELDQQELQDAQNLIDGCDREYCKLEDIYGELWEEIPDHRRFGKRFKTAVLARRLNKIEWIERDSGNRQRYRTARFLP